MPREGVATAIGEVPDVAAVETIEETAVTEVVRTRTRVRVKGPEVHALKDTPPIHPKAVVIATISGGPTVGTVWPPLRVPGSTRSRRGREGPTNLARKMN